MKGVATYTDDHRALALWPVLFVFFFSLMVEKQEDGLKLRDHVWVPKTNKAQNNGVELFCDL